MFTLGSSHTYQLYSKPCDMRKSFNSLVGLVRNELGREPLSGIVYVFVNRTCNFIKLLHWEDGGFVLYYKRLEQGTFTLPNKQGTNSAISWPELVLMIEGIEVKNYIQKRRYKLGE
jgi:transposase